MAQVETEREAQFRAERGIPQFRVEGQRRLLDRETDYRGVWVDDRGVLHSCQAGDTNHWHEKKDAALSCAMRRWQQKRA